jgi:hypothetical protein
MIRNDAPYFCERSTTEAVRSIQAKHPGVAAVHQELCLLYAGRALAELLSRRR